MGERQYSDEEVAAIFARATETQHPAPREGTSGQGMTLAQLQEIGREVGIAPDLVAQTVELGRRLSDAEWDRFVVDLRDTFDARGRVRNDGSFRQWTNGNLQVLLEPSGEGHRVRFKTVKADARLLIFSGLGLIGITASVLVPAMLTGAVPTGEAVGQMAPVGLIGVVLMGLGALRLPGWAKRRREQMADLTARLLAPPPSP
ncbi:MAG: hypothetical protein WD771_07805 [Gemmatimonadaceae bacterium]